MTNQQDFDSKQMANHVISHGYEFVREMILQKYDLDLDKLKNSTSAQIGILKDAARRSRWLGNNVDRLEELAGDIIDGEVSWVEGIAKIAERAGRGAEKIEKATGDMQNANLKWQAAQKKEGIKADERSQIIDNEVENFRQLSEHRIQSTLQVNATKLASDKAAISDAPNRALSAQADAEMRKEDELSFSQALNYGSMPPGIAESQGEIPTWEPIRMGHAIDVKVNSSETEKPLRMSGGIGGAVNFALNVKKGAQQVNKWMKGGR